jgi:hypothetical protein
VHHRDRQGKSTHSLLCVCVCVCVFDAFVCMCVLRFAYPMFFMCVCVCSAPLLVCECARSFAILDVSVLYLRICDLLLAYLSLSS